MSSYQNIASESMKYGNEDEALTAGHRRQTTGNKWIAVASVLVLAVFAMLSVFKGSSSSDASLMLIPLEGSTRGGSSSSSSSTRSCTFDECVKANCDHTLAPFTCLLHNGGPHGGCSSVTWSPETCDDTCDLSGCDELEMPDSLESCDGISCKDDWCHQGQLCGSDVPYQCTEGAGRFGCSDDSYHWVLHGCACCDVTTCE